MSLIVVRKFENEIYIVGDTKLTYDPSNNSKQAVNKGVNIKDGIIKTFILREDITICFAGHDRPFKKVIQDISTNENKEIIIEKLIASNIESGNKTDYILCSLGKNNEIHKISNHKSEIVDVAWIGDIEAFKQFQKAKIFNHSHLILFPLFNTNSKEFILNMYDSMWNVIFESTITSVGGFCTFICSNNNNFKYIPYLHEEIPAVEIESILKIPKEHIVKSDVQNGGFTIIFKGGKRGIGVYFPQGETGLIYSWINGLENPKIFNKSIFEFEIEMSEEIGEKFICIKSSLSDYCLAVQKTFKEKKYNLCFDYLKKGLDFVTNQNIEVWINKIIKLDNLKNNQKIKNDIANFSFLVYMYFGLSKKLNGLNEEKLAKKLKPLLFLDLDLPLLDMLRYYNRYYSNDEKNAYYYLEKFKTNQNFNTKN